MKVTEKKKVPSIPYKNALSSRKMNMGKKGGVGLISLAIKIYMYY